jgi:hypothetical protein
VGIVGFGGRVKENLLDIILAPVCHGFKHLFVSARNNFRPWFAFPEPIEFYLQKFALNSVTPKQVGRRGISRPPLILAIKIDRAIALKVVVII